MISRSQIEPERWERRFSTADIGKDLNENEIQSTVKSAINKGVLKFNDLNNRITIVEIFAVSKYGRLTNGGDVLFGINPAIRHPQIRVRAAYFVADKATDEFKDIKSFEGPLVSLFEGVYGFILLEAFQHFHTLFLKILNAKKNHFTLPKPYVRD